MDQVFKALADQSRRSLLNALRHHDGQTLSDLCLNMDMSRQAVSKHLNILIDANLIVPLKEGRFKKHYLNPIPIQQIADRWIDEFRSTQVNAIIHLKGSLKNPS